MDQSKKGFLPVLQGVKLSQTQCPTTSEDREKMKVIPYASAIGSIMYAMLCTRPDVCLAISLAGRYQSNCRCYGNGGPQTCLPAACGVAQGAAQHGPSSSARAQDPREGPSLAGWTTRSFLRHGLIRLAHEEAESSRQGTSRGAHDASHDDQGC